METIINRGCWLVLPGTCAQISQTKSLFKRRNARCDPLSLNYVFTIYGTFMHSSSLIPVFSLKTFRIS